MSRQERRARDAIENELEIAGANRHDYRYTSFAGKIVAQRDSTFDPYQRDMQGRTNIQRIREGLSPYDRDGERVVIHHANQSSEGPLIELTRAEHDSIRVRRDPTEIDRPDSRDIREIYWMARAASIRNPEPELFHYK
ncbi:MAG: HNH/ENDO VII family nuclease [Desulfomonilaceae bacterium]